jgi:hypothetical protein
VLETTTIYRKYCIPPDFCLRQNWVVPLKKFNQLQDEFFPVSKKMHEATAVQEKLTLLNRLQEILSQSKAVLDEVHRKPNRSARAPNARSEV